MSEVGRSLTYQGNPGPRGPPAEAVTTGNLQSYLTKRLVPFGGVGSFDSCGSSSDKPIRGSRTGLDKGVKLVEED